jgi:hypothetical protein
MIIWIVCTVLIVVDFVGGIEIVPNSITGFPFETMNRLRIPADLPVPSLSYDTVVGANNKLRKTVRFSTQDSSDSIFYNTGFFSINIYGGEQCLGPAEQYSIALNECVYDSIITDDATKDDDTSATADVKMKKYVNLTINSDDSITMTELLYRNVGCKHLLSSSTFSLPTCSSAGGRSYNFKYDASIPVFGTDGVLSMLVCHTSTR